MPPKSNELSMAEHTLLAQAMQCLKDKIEIDFVKLADIAGHSNPGSTKNAMNRILKKTKNVSVPSKEFAEPTKPRPKTPAKKPTAKDENGKGGKAAGTKRKAAEVDTGDDHEDKANGNASEGENSLPEQKKIKKEETNALESDGEEELA